LRFIIGRYLIEIGRKPMLSKIRNILLSLWSNACNFIRGFNSYWRFFAGGLAVVVILVSIVFALPLKTVTEEWTETYYATEMKKEAYTVTEPFTSDQAQVKEKVLINGYYGVLPGGTSVPFYIERPSAQVQGRFENIIPGGFTITGIGNRIIWERLAGRGSFDLALPQGWYQANFREDILWGEQVYIYLVTKWTEQEKTVVYNTVTRYRDVPVQVEKRKVSQEQRKVSIWQDIFD
jgi:hypothetical protein